MSDFNTSLEAGKVYENMVLERVKVKYPNAYIKHGKFKDYDIFVPEISMSIEVKADFKSIETGNFVVEVEFNKQLSALSTTKADVWVFLNYEGMFWAYPLSIYRCIEQNEFRRVSFVGNGDTVGKKAYLIPCATLAKFCHKMNKYFDEEIKLLPLKRDTHN